MGSPMRTLGLRTNVLLAIAGAIGVLYSLSRPWYGGPLPGKTEDEMGIGDIHGPLNAFSDGVRRWIGTDGVSGWQALDHWGQMVAAMAAVAAVGSLACLIPGLQALGRDFARYGSLAALAIVAWKLVDPPGDNAVLELRSGALIAGVLSVMLFVCASGVASVPQRRKVPQRTFQAPPPPPAYGPTGAGGP
jgi:hypothetical protein